MASGDDAIDKILYWQSHEQAEFLSLQREMTKAKEDVKSNQREEALLLAEIARWKKRDVDICKKSSDVQSIVGKLRKRQTQLKTLNAEVSKNAVHERKTRNSPYTQIRTACECIVIGQKIWTT